MFSVVNIVQASDTDSDELQSTTYRFLQYVKEGEDHAAIAALEKLKRANNDHLIETSIPPEEINTLLNETQITLEDSYSSPKEKYHKAITIVLLYDAMWNKEDDALWITWKSYLENEIDRITKNEEISKASLQYLYTLYERLLPAFKTSLSEEEYTIIAKHQNKFLNILSEGTENKHTTFVSTLATDLKTLPTEEKEKKSFTEEPGFIWLLFSVGGLIVSTLSYVGWRKYKGEKGNKENQKERGS